MRTIEFETGDFTENTGRRRKFVIASDRLTARVHLTFDSAPATVDVHEWAALLTQVKTGSLADWKYSRISGPMGRLDFQRLLSEVRNTPAYQLMLAGFDIAEFIALVSDLEDPIVLSRFISLAQRIPSNFGSRGIFFVPNSILADAGPALEELIANTKVCQATATIGEAPAVAKYYLPYATPIEFPVGASPQARQLWERIRDYYYAFR